MTHITIKLPADAQQICDVENRQMNTVSIEIPAYSRSGIRSIWEEIYTLSVDVDAIPNLASRWDQDSARHTTTMRWVGIPRFKPFCSPPSATTSCMYIVVLADV